MSVEIIEKELLFTLSGPEIIEIRKSISSCEAKIAVLNEEIIKNLEVLTKNQVVRKCKVVVETNEIEGFVKEFVNGQLIEERSIPRKKKEEKEKHTELIQPLTNINSSPREDDQPDPLTLEVLDPDYVEDLDLF